MVDYVTLMAKKKGTKSDWMLEKWADANGYLDDPEPSVDVEAVKEEEGRLNMNCPACGKQPYLWDEATPEEHMAKQHPDYYKGMEEEAEVCPNHRKPYSQHNRIELDDDSLALEKSEGYPEDKVNIQYRQPAKDPTTPEEDELTDEAVREYLATLAPEKGEAGKTYAGTCPRCNSDNTKKTKSQTGTIIGLCNDCGETWPIKEAVDPNAQKGGELPLGKTGKPGDVSKVSKPPEKKPLQPQTSPPTELPQKKEPDPSNPDKELNPDPELPPRVDAPAPDSDKPTDDDSIQMKPQTYSANGVELPDKVEIPERLFNDLMMMIEYSKTNDNEAGGFLIVAKHGEIGVVGEQFGKDREIVLEPNEELHEGESLIGTVHMHPVTPTASTGDVTGYLNDENEKVMVVVGADKSINFFFKVPEMTAEGDYGDEISDNFEQEDMGMMAEGFGFIWYRGEESDRTELHLMDNIIEDLEFDVLDESWPVEKVIDALGIKGRPDIPESYSTKKTPLRLQIPFSWHCDERRLI